MENNILTYFATTYISSETDKKMLLFFKAVKVQIKSGLTRFYLTMFLQLFQKCTVFSLGVLPSLRLGTF